MPIITARKDSTCFRCHQRIVAGVSRVKPYRIPGRDRDVWGHVSCPVAPARLPAPARPSAPADDYDDTDLDDGPVARPAPAAPPLPPAADLKDALRPVVRALLEVELDDLGPKTVAGVVKALQDPIAKLVQGAVDKALAAVPPKVVEVRRPDAPPVRIENEPVHERFADVVEMIGMREDMFLPGPTGSGKTFLVRQAAKALSVPFGMISCSKGMSEGQLTGRLIPRGEKGGFEFVSTLFLHVYEGGGVFLFDEIDAADANVLLLINSGLANGVMAVPNRTELPPGVSLAEYTAAVEAYDYKTAAEPFAYAGYGPYACRHPEFVAAAAANTFGTGADRKYVGRDPLDLSTLDRFLLGTIEVDYSPAVERALCPDAELLRTLWQWRAAIARADLNRVVSTRFCQKAYKMLATGWDVRKIASRFFSGWSGDEITAVYGRPADWK